MASLPRIFSGHLSSSSKELPLRRSSAKLMVSFVWVSGVAAGVLLLLGWAAIN